MEDNKIYQEDIDDVVATDGYDETDDFEDEVVDSETFYGPNENPFISGRVVNLNKKMLNFYFFSLLKLILNDKEHNLPKETTDWLNNRAAISGTPTERLYRDFLNLVINYKNSQADPEKAFINKDAITIFNNSNLAQNNGLKIYAKNPGEEFFNCEQYIKTVCNYHEENGKIKLDNLKENEEIDDETLNNIDEALNDLSDRVSQLGNSRINNNNERSF